MQRHWYDGKMKTLEKKPTRKLHIHRMIRIQLPTLPFLHAITFRKIEFPVGTSGKEAKFALTFKNNIYNALIYHLKVILGKPTSPSGNLKKNPYLNPTIHPDVQNTFLPVTIVTRLLIGSHESTNQSKATYRRVRACFRDRVRGTIISD